MNSIQISKFLTKHVKYFQGVCQIDLLSSTIIQPSIIVIKVHMHYYPGSRWVAFLFFRLWLRRIFWFVRFATVKLEIKIYLQHHSISWTFNCHWLQGLTSIAYGYYCCLYALHRPRGMSMTSIVNICLPARYTCNDIRAVSMFRVQFWECSACCQLGHRQQSCRSEV